VRGVNNLSWVFFERLAHGYLSVRQRTGFRTRRLPGLAADGFLCGSSPRAHANQQPDAKKAVTSGERRVDSPSPVSHSPLPVTPCFSRYVLASLVLRMMN